MGKQSDSHASTNQARPASPPTPQGGGAPETLRIWLLGGFKVSVNSRSIEEGRWRLRNARSLLKLLALAPGHRLHREQAMDALWPDSGRKAASNNLRQTLHAARRALHPSCGLALPGIRG